MKATIEKPILLDGKRQVFLVGYFVGEPHLPWKELWLKFKTEDGTEITTNYTSAVSGSSGQDPPLPPVRDLLTIAEGLLAKARYFKDAEESDARAVLAEIEATLSQLLHK